MAQKHRVEWQDPPEPPQVSFAHLHAIVLAVRFHASPWGLAAEWEVNDQPGPQMHLPARVALKGPGAREGRVARAGTVLRAEGGQRAGWACQAGGIWTLPQLPHLGERLLQSW